MILSVCDLPEVLEVMRIIEIVIDIIRIAVPIMLIVISMIELTKVVASDDNDALRKTLTHFVERAVASILVFLIPTFVNIVVSLTSSKFTYTECIGNVTTETIKNAYENRADDYVSRVEKTLDITDYNYAVTYVNKVKDEKVRVSFLTRLEKVEKEIKKEEEKKKEEEIKPSVITGSVTGEKGKYTFNGSNNQYVKVKALNEEFIVVKTKGEVLSYAKFISDKKIYQSSNRDKYGDKCLGFTYLHAWGLYNNNRSYTADNGANYSAAGHFYTFIHSDMNVIMNIIYNEITNGKPLILQVNGNKKGTSRHYVTVVGFKSSVKSANSLTQKDLLIIDSWDGKLERMDGSSSRFMTSGKDCHKSYNGYYLAIMK